MSDGNGDTKALVRSEDFDVRGTALEVYGSRESIREMVARLMSFHPAAREVGREGMLGAAHLAHLVGASPLPSVNEIHIWQDKNGKNCVTLGINYYRRRARELGGVYWVEEPRLMTNQERDERAIDGKDYAALARAARRADVDRFVADMFALVRGASFKDVFEAALQMHTRTGIGSCQKGAYAKKGRPPAWTALKGAEIDLFRQLFPNLEQKPEPGRMAQIVEEIPKSGVDDDTLTMEEIEALARMRDRGDEWAEEWESLDDDEQQARGEHAGAVLYGRDDDDDLEAILQEAEANARAAEVKARVKAEAQAEPLPDIDLDEVEEVPLDDEEEPEPVVPDDGPESAIADRQDPAAAEAEPEPEPETLDGWFPRLPEGAVEPDVLRGRLRSSARWIKDGSRPNKREMGDRAQPPKAEHLKALNITLREGLKEGRAKADTKEIDEARRDLLEYVYYVRTSSALTAKEVGALRAHFAESNGQLRQHAAAEMWAIVAAHRADKGQAQLPGM